MKSVSWSGAAKRPARTLTHDIGAESITNQHPESIKIDAAFVALFKALGLAKPTLATMPVAPSALVISITGTGPSSDITLDIDDQITQHTGAVPLPWTYTSPSPIADFGGFAVLASGQDGSGANAATITCTITEAGKEVSTNTATGPYAIAQCSDNG